MAPILMVMFIFMDYAFWEVFFALAGWWAILYMAVIVIVELVSVIKLALG